MLQTRAKIYKIKKFQKRCASNRTPFVLYLYLIILRLFGENEGRNGENNQQKAINTALREIVFLELCLCTIVSEEGEHELQESVVASPISSFSKY